MEPLTRLPRFFQNALDTLSLKERDDELFLLPEGEGARRADEGFRFIRISLINPHSKKIKKA